MNAIQPQTPGRRGSKREIGENGDNDGEPAISDQFWQAYPRHEAKIEAWKRGKPYRSAR
jgi:hypothetical protein